MMTEQLSRKLITSISQEKNEPGWMTDIRLRALDFFLQLPFPSWGPDLSTISKDNFSWYIKPGRKTVSSWDAVSPDVKKVFDQIGVPQAEREFLAGVGVQVDMHIIYQQLKRQWQNLGVIFLSMDEAVHKHPDFVKKYFASLVPIDDNKFAALNTALWSGGAFVYVPSGVRLEDPLQTYFWMGQKQIGQFERTLIIAEPGSYIHFVEGCSAPIYSASSLHAGVVELFAHDEAHIRYTTIQNWSTDVYNLVTKRAIACKNATIEWIDGNLGAAVTMKYPTTILQQEGARGELISLAVATGKQHQDTGGRMIHNAPQTSSCMISRSISKHGGCNDVRASIKVVEGADHVRAYSQCSSLLIGASSSVRSYPSVDVKEQDAHVAHEASVSTFSDEQLFYLNSRGFSTDHARSMIMNGFIDVFVDKLPLEYAVEINRLLEME